jgi:hypothetical protein
MKTARTVLYTLLGLGALFLFGRFFLSQLGSGRTDDLAGVVLAPPPGFEVTERGELSPSQVAAELESAIARAASGKVGIRFERQGSTVYWLADLGADLLEERAAGPSGTRIQTVWRGGVRDRLRWARTHGDLAVPGLPPPERANLYH